MNNINSSLSLWDSIGLSDKETLISGMLGWLLNPNGDHGFGNDFLNGFLGLINYPETLDSNTVVKMEEKSSKNRFDISVIRDNQRLAIVEVKTKTFGSIEQLKRYENEADVVIRVAFDEWNFTGFTEDEKKRFNLIKFDQIAILIDGFKPKTPKYSDFLESFSSHLKTEYKFFEGIRNFYLGDATDLPINYNREAGSRFFSFLLLYWLADKLRDKKILDNDKGMVKSERSGVWLNSTAKLIGEGESLYLSAFNTTIEWPCYCMAFFEIYDRNNIVGNPDEIIGSVQLRISESKFLENIHLEFLKSKAKLEERKYSIAKRNPRSRSYYNAFTRQLTRSEFKLKSVMEILEKDFKEFHIK